MYSSSTLTVAQRLSLAFGAVVFILVVVAGMSLQSSRRLAEAEQWNVHTHKVIAAGESMLTGMINMETGARGYFVAGDERFLEPWKAGIGQFERAWQDAKALTADNPAQQQRLLAMQARHREFRQVVENLMARRAQVQAGTLALDAFVTEFAQGRDKAAMDGFRELGDAFGAAEQTLLSQRAAEAEATRSVNQRVIVVGSLLAVAVAVAAGAWITRSIRRQLGGEPGYAAHVARRVADGDLAFAVEVRAGATASLLAAMQQMQRRLQDMVQGIRTASGSIATGSSQIAMGNADLSQRTEEQASNLQQTAASMDQLAGTVTHNAQTAREATSLASQASEAAVQGGEVVGRVVHTMQGISASSRKIADIISVIDGIAFQTNILALNAAVEAARAGEQGRGFAVVATEVRNLAQRSAEAAKEIKSLIGDSVDKVEAGSQLVAEAGRAMDDIVERVRQVATLMTQISHASSEQTQGIADVSHAVSQLDQVTQQNAALVEESASAAESLRHQAESLVRSVSAFRLEAN